MQTSISRLIIAPYTEDNSENPTESYLHGSGLQTLTGLQQCLS